jgi:hypothetical protein
MFTYLLVGDPHVTVEDLEDCEGLVDCILVALKVEKSVSAVVLMGDLHHNHAIVHVDVIAFWRRAILRILEQVPRVIILRGNHDAPTSGSEAHALMAYTDMRGVTVVDEPMVIDNIAFMPYMAERDRFVVTARTVSLRDIDPFKTPTLICHQTFDGSRYENGFFAGDGIDPSLIPMAHVISGHIHAPQSFGKVWYPGAPRWRTVSDANTERAVYAQDFSDDGVPIVARRHSTHLHCRAIWKTTVKNGQVVEGPGLDDPRVVAGDQWHVDIYGAADANRTLAATITRPSTHVRCFDTDIQAPKVRESEGIDVSFRSFIGSYRPRHETPVAVLEKMAAERFAWK